MTDPKRLSLDFAPPRVDVHERPDGSRVLRSPLAPQPAERQVGLWLRRHAAKAPERTFLAERRDGAWYELSYAEARRQVDTLSARLLELGLGPERPLAILSDNSVDSGLLHLAAMQVGVPVAPISPAYSLASRDLAKLGHCLDLLSPGAVFAAEGKLFARALERVPADARRIVTSSPPTGAQPLSEWLAGSDESPSAAVERAFAATGPDSIAKFLFTSGSTGTPKAVINTQGMLCSNQAAIRQVWPFLGAKPPVVVDWLPWSHTFGGNHNLHMVLANGGSLYIDGGKPLPDRVGQTVENLRSIAPTLYFNVPRGFGLLLPFLESDAELARHVFQRLDLVFYAGAALSQDLWERLEAVSLAARGALVPLVSAWGSTETSPLVTSVHYPIERAGNIGLPVPGVELKMVPSGSKFELRVKGPNVTPGYWKQPELTAAAFDEEGFYRIGDAGRLEDPADPSRGVVFDGRVAEDFKLSSGTWVHAGRVRIEAIAHSGGVLGDAVVCGHDRDGVRLLGIPAWSRIDTLSADLGPEASPAEKLCHPAVRQALRAGFAAYNRSRANGAECVHGVLLLAEPLSIDAGEITDKGYINQRAMLESRAADVERLYSGEDPAIVTFS